MTLMNKKFNDDFKNLATIYEHFVHPRKSLPWLHFLDEIKITSMLDIGGGTGRITENFYPEIPLLYLADFSFPMLQAAHRKRILLETCCLVEKLPFRDESFDCVIMVDAFHHLVDQKTALHEVIRVLRVGGVFILEEPDIEKWQVKLIAIGEKILGMRSKFFRKEEIIQMLNPHNLAIKIEHNSINYFVRIKKIKKVL